MNTTTNLLSMDRAAMNQYFAGLGEKPFRSQQLLQWIYQRKVMDYEEMTDLSKALRLRLKESTCLTLPRIVNQQVSSDGTCKWLMQLQDGNSIEAVFIPEDDRGTLCVSSQVGCSLNCTFCATARQGFSRHLTVDEIIGQLWVANHALEEMGVRTARPDVPSDHRRPVTNVVMMGMGEPLANFDNVVAAMNLMMDDFTFGLSRRRVTLSTAGMVPAIDRLAEACPVSLAVSLHAPNDALRDQLVPLNKKYPIESLLGACQRFIGESQRQRITFEYVMLQEVNDTPSLARELAALLADMPAKVNLIPFNPFEGIQYQRSSKSRIDRFRDILLSKNIFTVTRKTRGDDIDAACGQLAGDFTDRTRRSERMRRDSVKVAVV
ncbi:MAG: 23S rRNA (adenine(2503)-C(2))-methyltransferase RlmN [Acidiferrobacterales bacterium]|nr:23S rRNA (adenine(2503)-C(2))-methyltransferase RlmN [Acidiferrobacterales bacterium]